MSTEAKEVDQNHYTDYANGIRDCMEGKKVPVNPSDRYLAGYGDQYTLEQVISHG